MVQLKPHRPHRQQQPLLAACTTSSPKPAEPAVRRAHADEVLLELRAEDRTIFDFAAARALLRTPMHDPSDSQRIAALLDRAAHVRRSRDAAFELAMEDEHAASAERCADIAAAEWIDDTLGRYMAEKAVAILDATPPTLTAGTDLTDALADLDELLAEPLPGSYWLENLRAVLPPAVAQTEDSGHDMRGAIFADLMFDESGS